VQDIADVMSEQSIITMKGKTAFVQGMITAFVLFP